MLIKRLYLRNYRVYEDPLELYLPPGLVGIYGPNGAGKSTLLEAIVWTLWGKARTTKEHIRTSGVGGECVTEVEFEHEGHLYLVRRSIRGANSAVAVEAHCDGAMMSTGTREAQRYVESVLGMDDAAFRASVFTEQKQLAAFSDQTPAERRRLVLQLLGITPLDAARDAARRDARELSSSYTHARQILPDLVALAEAASDADAKAEADERAAAEEATAAEAVRLRAVAALKDFQDLDVKRQEHDSLVAEGKAARQQLDALAAAVAGLREELTALHSLIPQVEMLRTKAAGAADTAQQVALLDAVQAAVRALGRSTVPPEPPAADETTFDQAAGAAASAREQLAAAEALAKAAQGDLQRASQAASKSASLSGEADCPVCGQALGGAFERVQQHRAQELADAEERVTRSGRQVARAKRTAQAADAHLAGLKAEITAAREARASWEASEGRRQEAARALADAWEAFLAGAQRAEAVPSPPEAARIEELAIEARRTLERQRAAQAELHRIQGRLERRPVLEASLPGAVEKLDAAQAGVEALREKLRALEFEPAALDRAAGELRDAEQAVRRADATAREAALAAARSRERASAAAEKLIEGRSQHDTLSELEKQSRHVGRVADLLSDFRNTVVASVGPRLAGQAAELFGELTDHEYEQLQVNPDTYEVQIGDGGKLYGLDRFSGSEVDLANLAMRVAISEHIHFQSGGAVGLLVLDEVFGPLDQDRKERMLLALDRLRGRFRQVLVVTHDPDIKEQLPNAVEVRKLPGRRAAARVLNE